MLTASQRTTLLREISSLLSGADWPVIDVTLEQFKLPLPANYDGSSGGYILKAAKDAPDSALLELAAHLGFKLPNVEPEQKESNSWPPGLLRVFISHLAQERVQAGTLQGHLLRYGIAAFVAHKDIKPSLEWRAELEAALSSAHALVALLHPTFHESEWTDQEVGFAMGRGIPVFSVSLGATPYGFIGRFQAFAGTGKSAPALARELYEAYVLNPQTRGLLATALVAQFEAVESFADAKAKVDLLEAFPSPRSDLAPRIERAAKVNPQIAKAWNVPERAKMLAKRWRTSGA